MVEQALSRKEREDYERKRYIMDVAERLFSQNGFHQTSVADIAREAEFGVGTLYKYFKDKDTLFQELVDDRLLSLYEEVNAIFDTDATPAEIVESVIDSNLDRILDHFDFYRIYFSEIHAKAHECHEEKINHGIESLITKMVLVFQRGIDEGYFANHNPLLLASALNGMMMSFFFLLMQPNAPQIDIEYMKKSIKDIFFGPVLVSPPPVNGELS